MINNQDGTYRGDIEPLPMPDDNQFILPQPKATPPVNTPPIGTLANPPSHLRPNTPIKPPQIRPFGPTVQINRPDPRIFPVANFPLDTSSGIQLGNSPFVNLNPNYWASRPAGPGTVQSAYNGPLSPDVANLPEATFDSGTDSSTPTGATPARGAQGNATAANVNAAPTYVHDINDTDVGGGWQATHNLALSMINAPGQSNRFWTPDEHGVTMTPRAGGSGWGTGLATMSAGWSNNQRNAALFRAFHAPQFAGKNISLGQSAIFQEPSTATSNILRGR